MLLRKQEESSYSNRMLWLESQRTTTLPPDYKLYIPTSYKEMECEDSVLWKEADEKEYSSILENNTFFERLLKAEG